MIKLIDEFWHFTGSQNISFFYRILALKIFLKQIYKRFSKIIRYRLKKNQYKLVLSLDQLNCKKTNLFLEINRKNFISQPTIFPAPNSPFEALSGVSPNIAIYLLEKCIVFSRSSSIADGMSIYNHSIAKMNPIHDFKEGILQTIDSYATKNVSHYTKKIHDICDSSIFIHLLNGHSKNYYHWLFEIMPKFIKICEVINNSEDLKKEKFTLLLDDGLPQQFYQILKLYAIIDYDIKIVKRLEAISCPKIIYCTDFWTSLDNTRFKPNIKEEFFVDNFATSLIKEKLNQNLFSILAPKRKIYLERKMTQLRSLNNSNEIRDFLVNEGFEIIYPNEFTFEEQIRLFSEASIVIGASGAAFSNIVFMQPNTHAIIFSPKTNGANYYIFQPMADIAKVNLTHILTNNSSQNQSIHASASVNIEEIKALLRSIV